MHAQLISHPSSQTSLKLAISTFSSNLKVSPQKIQRHPDVFIINQASAIPISDIRLLKRFAHQKPSVLAQKGILIHQAHTLTLPAQNALLKTLEEPPGYTIIILTTPNPSLLLPTIISRCQLITPKHTDNLNPPPPTHELSQLIKNLPTLTSSQLVFQANQHSLSKDQAIQFCQNLLQTIRQNLRQKDPSHPQNLHQTHLALTRLKANVNPKLTLENLFLHLR